MKFVEDSVNSTWKCQFLLKPYRIVCKYKYPTNLGGEARVILHPLPPIWFSLNNSEMVKAVMLAFCNIQ